MTILVGVFTFGTILVLIKNKDYSLLPLIVFYIALYIFSMWAIFVRTDSDVERTRKRYKNWIGSSKPTAKLYRAFLIIGIIILFFNIFRNLKSCTAIIKSEDSNKEASANREIASQ